MDFFADSDEEFKRLKCKINLNSEFATHFNLLQYKTARHTSSWEQRLTRLTADMNSKLTTSQTRPLRWI